MNKLYDEEVIKKLVNQVKILTNKVDEQFTISGAETELFTANDTVKEIIQSIDILNGGTGETTILDIDSAKEAIAQNVDDIRSLQSLTTEITGDSYTGISLSSVLSSLDSSIEVLSNIKSEIIKLINKDTTDETYPEAYADIVSANSIVSDIVSNVKTLSSDDGVIDIHTAKSSIINANVIISDILEQVKTLASTTSSLTISTALSLITTSNNTIKNILTEIKTLIDTSDTLTIDSGLTNMVTANSTISNIITQIKRLSSSSAAMNIFTALTDLMNSNDIVEDILFEIKDLATSNDLTISTGLTEIASANDVVDSILKQITTLATERATYLGLTNTTGKKLIWGKSLVDIIRPIPGYVDCGEVYIARTQSGGSFKFTYETLDNNPPVYIAWESQVNITNYNRHYLYGSIYREETSFWGNTAGFSYDFYYTNNNGYKAYATYLCKYTIDIDTKTVTVALNRYNNNERIYIPEGYVRFIVMTSPVQKY